MKSQSVCEKDFIYVYSIMMIKYMVFGRGFGSGTPLYV